MNDSATLFLGLDGGGTGCRAALWRGGLLGQGAAGPANLTTDFDGGIANLLRAIANAALAAGLPDEALTGAIGHAGLAGVQSEAMAARAARRLPGRCRVTEDRDIAIAGALGASADGAVLAIGTGSFVGLRRGGAIRAVGGWGLQLSDQASGGWIGRAALAATLEAVDGMRARTDLTEALLARLGGAPQDIVGFAATARPADFGTLAPMVMEAAAAGDGTAREIVERGAQWLDRALDTLGHRADEPIYLTGGLGPLYRAALERPGRRFADPQGTPLDGALILARQGGQ
ncbi:BadF/BadG/BcrA/BcrD ATPase family protein [uncultured Limimaricola sp.]|uniref:BadF/BadG/BcrA/BcrD ATPase family protein n=1 Tax=uncultured Limimaricola sp. TaxID=2211667 RepID=UPI0030FBD20C